MADLERRRRLLNQRLSSALLAKNIQVRTDSKVRLKELSAKVSSVIAKNDKSKLRELLAITPLPLDRLIEFCCCNKIPDQYRALVWELLLNLLPERPGLFEFVRNLRKTTFISAWRAVRSMDCYSLEWDLLDEFNKRERSKSGYSRIKKVVLHDFVPVSKIHESKRVECDTGTNQSADCSTYLNENQRNEQLDVHSSIDSPLSDSYPNNNSIPAEGEIWSFNGRSVVCDLSKNSSYLKYVYLEVTPSIAILAAENKPYDEPALSKGLWNTSTPPNTPGTPFVKPPHFTPNILYDSRRVSSPPESVTPNLLRRSSSGRLEAGSIGISLDTLRGGSSAVYDVTSDLAYHNILNRHDEIKSAQKFIFPATNIVKSFPAGLLDASSKVAHYDKLDLFLDARVFGVYTYKNHYIGYKPSGLYEDASLDYDATKIEDEFDPSLVDMLSMWMMRKGDLSHHDHVYQIVTCPLYTAYLSVGRHINCESVEGTWSLRSEIWSLLSDNVQYLVDSVIVLGQDLMSTNASCASLYKTLQSVNFFESPYLPFLAVSLFSNLLSPVSAEKVLDKIIAKCFPYLGYLFQELLLQRKAGISAIQSSKEVIEILLDVNQKESDFAVVNSLEIWHKINVPS